MNFSYQSRFGFYFISKMNRHILLEWGENFCNISMWCTIRLMILSEVVKYTRLWDAVLAWYSPNTTRSICRYRLKHDIGRYVLRAYLKLPDRRLSSNPSKISSTFRLLYYFHLLHNKCFYLLSRSYAPEWTLINREEINISSGDTALFSRNWTTFSLILSL